MDITQEYRLHKYQDYGTLGTKEHIKLLRNKESGQICVKKTLAYTQRDVLEFRKRNHSVYFPQIYECFEEENEVILIEEYINGITLEEYMAGSPLPEEEATRIACQIGKALSELHHADPMIVYRDLKTENIMITTDGNVKLIDFNISRTFQKGKKRDTALLGTAEYAAPEQFGYFQTDNRTDVYAFGVVFNYMLTGHFPIDGIYEGKYKNLIQKCIELEPSKRYQTIDAILAELGMHEEGQEDEKATWAIPGFRSNVTWKRIVAVVGYIFILYMSLTMEFVEDGKAVSTAMQWVNRLLLTSAQIMTVMFACNYRGISESIPFYRHRSVVVRVISYVVTWFLTIAAAVILSVVIESVFRL